MKEKIAQAIVVEGKYDKIRLANIYDTIIVVTDGFGIFSDKAKQNYIKKLANTCGIIVLTDSDGAGFVIRNFIKSICTSGKVYNAYIPDIIGKEKRKAAPSKENKLGVEGIDDDVIRTTVKNVSSADMASKRGNMTMTDMYELGLTGSPYSSYLRKKLTSDFELPEHISPKSLLEIINIMYTYEEISKKVMSIMQEREE